MVEKEVHIMVPTLKIWIWAQLVDDCPALLSLGILCGKQGWNYEWKSGKNPTLSKGKTRITLTPSHDVPMVFAAKNGEAATEEQREQYSAADSTSASSCEERSSANQCGGGDPQLQKVKTLRHHHQRAKVRRPLRQRRHLGLQGAPRKSERSSASSSPSTRRLQVLGIIYLPTSR